MGATVAGGGDVRVRPVEGPGRRVRDRHAAAHRIRAPSISDTSSRSPTPTSIARFQRMRGQGGVLPDRVGRQRAAHRAAGAEPSSACSATRACPYDPRLPRHRPKPDPKRPVPIARRNFVELCARQTAEDEQAYEELWRRLGLSFDWSYQYTTIGDAARAASQRAFLRNLARGEAYTAEAPSLWDVTFADRGRPGRAGGPGAAGRLPPAAVHRRPTGRPSRSTRPGPSCCRPAWRWSATPTTSATPHLVGQRVPAPRCSGPRCRCTPTRWPTRPRAPASR